MSGQFQMVFIERNFLINGEIGSVNAICIYPPEAYSDTRVAAAGMIGDVLGRISNIIRYAGIVDAGAGAVTMGTYGVTIFSGVAIGAEAYQESNQIRSELAQGVNPSVVWGGAFARWSSTAAISGSAFRATYAATSWTGPATRGLGPLTLSTLTATLTGVIWTGSGADESVGRATQDRILSELGCGVNE